MVTVSSGASMTAEEAQLAGFSLPGELVESSPDQGGGGEAASLARLLELVEEAQSLNAAGIPEAFDMLVAHLSTAFGTEALLDRAFVRIIAGAPPQASDSAAAAQTDGQGSGSAATTTAAEAGDDAKAAHSREAPATSEDAGIDWDAVEQAMRALESSTTAAVLGRLAVTHRLAADSMFSTATSLGGSKPHTLRRLVITLLSPAVSAPLPEDLFPPTAAMFDDEGELLAEPEPDTPLQRVLAIVPLLGDEAQETLARWFSRMPERALARLIAVGHKQLDVMHRPRVQEQDVKGAAELLRLVNEGNEAHFRRERRRIVPFDAFYHTGVSDLINYESDYRRWRRSQTVVEEAEEEEEEERRRRRRRQRSASRGDDDDGGEDSRGDASATSSSSSSAAASRQSSSRSSALTRHRHRRPAAGFSFVSYPFLLSPAAKSAYLGVDARVQQITHGRQALREGFARRMGLAGAAAAASDSAASPYLVLEVRRSHIVEDTLQRVVNTHPKWQLKKPLRVKFVGEAGVDEGGVRKEFFQVMVRQLFNPDFGMFKEEQESHTLWFNHDSDASPVQWELLGTLLGLALYNGVLLDVQFPTLLYRLLRGEPPTLRDLNELRPSVAVSLQGVLDYEEDNMEDVLCLDFTAPYESWGAPKSAELIPGGKDIMVTQQNKQEYVNRYVRFTLHDLVAKQLQSFRRGFEHVADGPIASMLRPEELELLVVGSKELDFSALRDSARYEEPYSANNATVRWMWEVVLDELNEEEKRNFLAFVTGSDRAPIRGLGSEVITISRAGPDSDQLPSAHTCFSHLLLPEYATKDKLRSKLRAAISESEGFGLI